MELFTNTSRERLTAIAENFINNIFEERGNSNIEDLVSAFVNAGFTKTEFFEALDKYLLKNYDWEKEPKVNPETGEGVFWKEYTEDEDEDANPEEVNIGDSDQAILETALTQIGIPYTCKKIDEKGYTEIEIKTFDEGNEGLIEIEEEVAAKVYFTKDGKFDGIY